MKTRGGKQPGAGRPKLPPEKRRSGILPRITLGARMRLAQMANSNGMELPEFLEQLSLGSVVTRKDGRPDYGLPVMSFPKT